MDEDFDGRPGGLGFTRNKFLAKTLVEVILGVGTKRKMYPETRDKLWAPPPEVVVGRPILR